MCHLNLTHFFSAHLFDQVGAWVGTPCSHSSCRRVMVTSSLPLNPFLWDWKKHGDGQKHVGCFLMLRCGVQDRYCLRCCFLLNISGNRTYRPVNKYGNHDGYFVAISHIHGWLSVGTRKHAELSSMVLNKLATVEPPFLCFFFCYLVTPTSFSS